jgi:hypothetical protein
MEDSLNLNRPSISESPLTIVFTSHLPVVKEFLKFITEEFEKESSEMRESEQHQNILSISKKAKHEIRIPNDQFTGYQSLKLRRTRDTQILSGLVDATIHHLPPTAMNPGSLTGAKTNLRQLGQVMGVKGFVPEHLVQRNHLIVYEDGGGWVVTKNVIDNSFLDPLCKLEFDSKNEFVSHMLVEHPDYTIRC